MVSLLAESYNPHVRYGAAMALGIACAGTGLREAIALLEPMVKFDPVNFVRQGALIASAMILIQHTDQTCPKVNFFRQLYAEVITNKHEDVMAKFGAILAQGIIDAGGRNVTVGLQSRTGHTNLQAVVGMLVFTNYWYWFPLAHCLSLAFSPTSVIALNKDLKMPKIEFKSAARPSLYAYPAPMEEKKAEEREKVATVVLSTAARQKRREHADKKDGDDKMEVDEDVAAAGVMKTKDDVKDTEETIAAAAAAAVVTAADNNKKADEVAVKSVKKEVASTDVEMKEVKETKDAKDTKEGKEVSKDGKEASKDEKKKEPEPNFEILQNPARVLRPQLRVLSVTEGSNYTPLKDITIGGIIMMAHTADSEEIFVEPVVAYGPKNEDVKEIEAPEPFEYIEDWAIHDDS